MDESWMGRESAEKQKVSKLDADSPAAFNIARWRLATQGVRRQAKNQGKVESARVGSEKCLSRVIFTNAERQTPLRVILATAFVLGLL